MWVFIDDEEAAKDAVWARSHKVKIPQDLQIIGLEDRPSCYPSVLSTGVPDWEGCGYLMAHALMRDFPVARTRKGFFYKPAVKFSIV